MYGCLLIAVILWRPRGVFPWFARLYGWIIDHLPIPGSGQGVNEIVLLEVEGLAKRFGGVQAVVGLSFYVRTGEILGVIGPNGSGKTTTFNLITGFYPSRSGACPLCRGGDHGPLGPTRSAPEASAEPFRSPSRSGT